MHRLHPVWFTAVGQEPDRVTDRATGSQTDGRRLRWAAAVTDIRPALCEPHATVVPSQPARKAPLLSLQAASCQNAAVFLLTSTALNPDPSAKCKRGIRAHVKTAYSHTVGSKRPGPIHGVIQSDSTLSLPLSDNPVQRSEEEGWCLADAREHGVALC